MLNNITTHNPPQYENPSDDPTSDAFDIYIVFASAKGEKTQLHIAPSHITHYFMQLKIICIYELAQYEPSSMTP